MNARTQSPWIFVALTFAFTWLLLSPGVLASAGLLRLPVPTVALNYALLTVAQFGPSLMAFVLTWRSDGRHGAWALLRRAWNVRIPIRWLAVTVLGPLALGAAATALHLIGGGHLPAVSLLFQPAAILPTIVVIFLFLGPVPEEFGWRGYLLDRLQARWGALAASLILGALWAVWHLPGWYLEGSFQYLLPFWAFVLWDIALAVLITWLYNSTGRNLLVALLAHTAVNLANALFPTADPATSSVTTFYYLTALYIVAAAAIVLVFGARRLSREHTASAVPAAQFGLAPKES
jgi:membrane protease YdiL (CAAX protease family)